MNVDSSINAISLFSGGGGLDLGIRMVVPGCRVIAYVEREAYACEVLAARMDEGRLDPAPIWTDVSTFDGRPFRGLVDLVFGGFPCQDISNAGKREGIEGERSGLWSEFARIVREVGPNYVFVENVAALLARGLERVLGDLASLGFDAEWGVVSAADAGAPHPRERLWVLAYANGERLQTDSGNAGLCPEAVEHGWSARHATAGYSEGMRGSALPHKPCLCGVADGMGGGLDRDRVRLLGNGVVPQQAALALRTLADRIGGVK